MEIFAVDAPVAQRLESHARAALKRREALAFTA
jgi:hypothetical protein